MRRTETAPTYTATIYIAGDYARAKEICKAYCLAVGLCVTVSRADYVYTGGEEAGVIVGLINYPRFPSTPEAIRNHAWALAGMLRDGLYQHSFSIVTPEETFWDSRREGA